VIELGPVLLSEMSKCSIDRHVPSDDPVELGELKVDRLRVSSKGSPWDMHFNPVAGVRRKCIGWLPGDRGQSYLQLLYHLDQLPAEGHRLIGLAKLR